MTPLARTGSTQRYLMVMGSYSRVVSTDPIDIARKRKELERAQ